MGLAKILNSSRTTTGELYRLCEHYGIPINEICSKDQLYDVLVPLQGGYIINLQDSDDGNGTHWVALWLEKNKNRKKCFYFDSFGVDPPLAVMDFCSRYGAKEIITNTKEIQNINAGGCGQYCVDFLRHMTYRGKSKTPCEGTGKFNDFIRFFN